MADDAATTKPEMQFDPHALREKYRQERDKRLRSDGEGQFVEPTGDLARYNDEDPYVEPGYTREPLIDDIEIVIIGGGFSGLMAATRMREVGLTDIRIIEAGGDFGGTWYWNRYPGAQCDIESYCYMPLLEEANYVPREKYSYSPEIFEHSQRVARLYNLYDIACFQTRVNALRWDSEIKRWIVTTNRNDAMRARFVVVASGNVNRPKLPGIPGLDQFKGHTFHTSRWDYDYTGGDHSGGLTKLADKHVAIIGTGATAVQCIPHLGANAGHLFVFQRTPSSVDVRGNKPTDPEWAKSLKPGWQLERQENFNDVATGKPFEVDMVHDAWTDIFRKLQSLFPFGGDSELSPEEAARLAELADFEKMNQVRARVDATVKDPRIAEQLKPYYRQFCKRPTFNDDYLPTFNRPNVTLVDTSGSKGVQRITETGVVANDQEYKVDCIIFATGFEMSSAYKKRIGIDIYGENGQSLYDYWGDGMRTLHGHSSHGFPNWFFIGAGQNGVSLNFSSMINGQGRHIAHIIDETRARGALTVQPTVEAEADWVATVRGLGGGNDNFLESCTPGYYNNEGKFKDSAAKFFGDAYLPGTNAFNAILAQWREDGDLNGLEFG